MAARTRNNNQLERRNSVMQALRMVCDPMQDYVWRVSIGLDNAIRSTYIGFCSIDGSRTYTYYPPETAPDWLIDRLAVLQLMPPDPESSVVFGVGRRIDDRVYWVVQPIATLRAVEDV
jgi:hypothetical protein